MNSRNENRVGYKETRIGWIPQDWGFERLDQLCELIYGESPKDILDPNGKFPVVGSSDEYRFGNKFNSEHSTVIIGRKGSIDKPAFYDEPIWVTDTAYFSSENKNIDPKWLYYYLFLHKLARYNESTGVPSLNRSTLYTIRLPVPPLLEQLKISEILSTWDKAIELMGKKIKAKQRLKKGLMQKLLFGKMRFIGCGNPAIGGKLPEGWRLFKIGEVLNRERDPVRVHPRQEYQEIGIRSHGKGIFHKKKTNGAAIGNKSVFWVKPDCFIVNIVFAWEQAISKTTKTELGMIASHRFPMYKPKDGVLDLDYLLYFFQSPYGKHLLGLASPGGAGRNKTLGQETFRKLSIKLPPIEEQRKIGILLNACDREIEILTKYEVALKKQKQGLMQKLLTGDVRVNV